MLFSNLRWTLWRNTESFTKSAADIFCELERKVQLCLLRYLKGTQSILQALHVKEIQIRATLTEVTIDKVLPDNWKSLVNTSFNWASKSSVSLQIRQCKPVLRQTHTSEDNRNYWFEKKQSTMQKAENYTCKKLCRKANNKFVSYPACPQVDKPHLDLSMQWLNFKVNAWSAII